MCMTFILYGFTIYYIWFAKNWVRMGAGVPQGGQEEEEATLKRPSKIFGCESKGADQRENGRPIF